MANAALCIGWQQAKTGREGDALELFQHAMGIYAEWQAEGRIESFEPVLLAPHGGDLNGFILLRGDGAKLDALRRSDEFLDIETRARLCLDGIGTIQAYVGESVGAMMQRLGHHLPRK